MLGSSRTLVQAGGTSPCFDADFLPFGYEKDVTTTCSQNYKFEGKERDTETGDDDFGARYYTFRLGRWLSADWSSVPAPVPYANLTNPQTLNLYAMVSDNPESFADLDGHTVCEAAGGNFAQGKCSPDSILASLEGEGFSFDENTGIARWYLSEVSAAQTQLAAQQQAQQNANQQRQQKCGFWCRLFHTDHEPSKFVILTKETENKGSYSYFYYQLENKEGQKLKGKGSVEEHITGDSPIPLTTSEDRFVPLKHGKGKDQVGLTLNGQSVTPPGSLNADIRVEQTFTVRYGDKEYTLTTKFEHETRIAGGQVTNTVKDVVP